jgi:tetratricopeptide (TPR) repeat protein
MNCPKNHGPMERGKGFFVCMECAERVFDHVLQPTKDSAFSRLDALPFPVAFPLAHALDPVRCPNAHDRFDNMIFAASQALRLTALLLLSDYFECEVTCAKLDIHIRSLRMPHWQNWSDLARALSKFWSGHYPDKPERPCRFAWLPDAWLEVACTTQDASRWTDALRQIPGSSGQAVSVNDAFQKARNDAHHRLTTHSADSARACERALQQLLPLLLESCVLLFPSENLVLLRQVEVAPGRCIRLVGSHIEKRFTSEPTPQFSDPVFAKSQVVALSGAVCVPLHPLVVPIDPEFISSDPFEVEVLEPATLLDQAKDREIVLLGVQNWFEKEEYAKPFLQALERKRVSLGLSNDETKMWTLAAWATDNAKANLEELTGRKYLPDCYVERRGVDNILEICLQAPTAKGLLLIGEAGSGKSSLLCRLVEKLTEQSQVKAAAVNPKKKSSLPKTGDLESYLKLDGTQDAVIFLSGRAAFGGDAHLDGTTLLCGAVLQKAGIVPGAFDSLERLMAALHASVPGDTKSRKVWLILDALNEADRFEDLLAALDRFLPNLPRYPWLKLIVSIRSGAYQALNRRHSDLARTGTSFLENEHHFFSFEARGSDKTVPYLEVKPFEIEEGARAHELRQQRLPGKSVTVPWNDLGEPLRELLLNPLHLHLFHETFNSGVRYPGDLDAESLLNAYLEHLCTQNAGLERTLGQIGTLMFTERAPALSVAKADEWLAEWRNAGTVAGRSAKLNPIEELVSASLLLRPTEHGAGANRQLAAFQFRHQTLCEQVLLRELRRQIHPRKLPTGQELTAWVRQIAGPGEASGEPFKELLGAVQSMLKEVILSGAADVFAALFPVEPEEIRSQIIFGGLLKSELNFRDAERKIFFEKLSKYLESVPALADSIFSALGGPISDLGDQGLSIMERRYWEAAVQVANTRVKALPHEIHRKEVLAYSLAGLGMQCVEDEDTKVGHPFLEEALRIRRALVIEVPDDVWPKINVAVSLTQTAFLLKRIHDSEGARALFEEALSIRRALVEAEPQSVPHKQALSNALSQLASVSEPEAANALHEEAIAISYLLVDSHPQQPDLKRELAISLRFQAKSLLDDRRYQNAQALFESALELDCALSEEVPSRLSHKSDVCFSLRYLTEISWKNGDMQTARLFMEKSLPIERALVTAYPHRWAPKICLSELLQLLGEIYAEEGDTQTARALYVEATQIDCGLVATGPYQGHDHALLKAHLSRDIALPLRLLSRSCEQQGDTQTARALLEDALEVDRLLVAADCYREHRDENLSTSLKRLGSLCEKEGEIRNARGLFEESLHLKRVLLAESPADVPLSRQISEVERSLSKLASLLSGTSGGTDSF